MFFSSRQFRNENEKRRRDLFSQLIQNLEDILDLEKKPLPSSSVSSSSQSNPTNKTTSLTNKLDKASILRETAIYLRKHQNGKI